MKQRVHILGLPLLLLLGGCVFSPAQKTKKVSAVPPPPKPVSSAPSSAAPTASAPLSIPQTVALLPAPQPISPDALATATLKPPEEPAESQPGPRIPARRGQVAGPPRAEPAPPAQTPTPPPAAATAPAETVERAPIQEILPEAEKKRLQDSVDSRKRDIKKVLDQADPRRLNNAQRDLVARIRTLVQQSDDAGTRNDWRQADALAGQALVLVRELQSGR